VKNEERRLGSRAVSFDCVDEMKQGGKAPKALIRPAASLNH